MGAEKLQPPTVDCILLCQKHETDPATTAVTVFNPLPRIIADGFPYNVTRLGLVIHLSDGRGRQKIGIAVTNDDRTSTLRAMQGEAVFEGPFTPIEITAYIGPLQFEKSGAYRIVVARDEQIIGERRFYVGPRTL